MSTSSLCLTELPTELLEQILLRLPGQDIIKTEGVKPALSRDDVVLTLRTMIQVSQCFAGLIRGSSSLQYRRELFSAGLIDNSHNPRSLAERRKLCREYVDKWTGEVKVAKKTYRIPGEHYDTGPGGGPGRGSPSIPSTPWGGLPPVPTIPTWCRPTTDRRMETPSI
jgi:hypothetical protein